MRFWGENRCFGFNGKEKDSEFNGNYDYGLRIYDAHLGRFLSVDPLTQHFPFWSPYHFAGNTPIQAIDLEGAEIKKVVHYLDQHADGTLFVVKTDVQIQKDASVTIDGKKYAKTEVEYVYQGEYYDGGTIHEPIVEGGIKPSASYDYTQDVIEGKMTEDLDYMMNGTDDEWYDRPGNVLRRDANAPDNAITMQDVEDLKNVVDRRPKIKKDKGADDVLGVRKKKNNNNRKDDYKSTEAEHKKNARSSTANKHEKGQSRKSQDKGGEKGDARRKRYK